jgi:integrase
VPTFEQAAVAWHEKNRGQWAEKTQRNWISSMRAYAFPVLGKLLVSAVTTAKVLEVIEPIWTKKRKTATQVRARIESVLAAQRAAGLVSDNVAEWSGHLDAVLPAPSKIAPTKRHASVPYVEMPGFMADLRAREGLPARALEFLILTGVRSNEALGAEWSEIDLENAVWKIPGSRMKMKKDHSVPLTDRALAILRALPRETAASNFVFIGARKGGHLGRNFLPELMDDMGRTETVHGFRTSLRSWAGDCSDTPSDVCEAALAHYPTGVEAAYMRSNQLEKRRALMNAWSEYCGRPPRNATVTPLRPQRIVTEQISVREGA